MNFKSVSSGIIIALLPIVGVLCLITPVMAMQEHDNMATCLQAQSSCSIDPLDHIGMWQAMFRAIPQATASGAILILLLIAILLAPRTHARQESMRVLKLAYPAPPSALRAIIFNQIQEAFSRGILHSRRFAFAALIW